MKQINIIKRIKQALTNFKASCRDKALRQHKDELRRQFCIVEKNGMIYILHNGTAVCKFFADDNAQIITTKLNLIRDIAVSFDVR